jgi:hypothetical protein
MLVSSIAQSVCRRAKPLAVPLRRAEIPSYSEIQLSMECASDHAVVSDYVRCPIQLTLPVLDRAPQSGQ